MFIYDSMVERWIEEDVPGFDLTTHLLELDNFDAHINFKSRAEICVCGTEEAAAVFKKLGAELRFCQRSGSMIREGDKILCATGNAAALHAGWRVALNLIEYSSGIATRTANLVKKAKKGKENILVCGTRKCFPGTRRLSQKALLAGGGIHHRMGLGETILFFPNHYNLMGFETFLKKIKDMKAATPEKKFGVEVASKEHALLAAQHGVDTLQVDKFSPEEIAETTEYIRRFYPDILIAAAGGVNLENAEDYARAGADILVTSWMYFGKPADISAVIS